MSPSIYPQILEDPLRNRGTAFTAEQRRVLGLDGLLPPAIETLEQQAARSIEVFRRRPGALDKYVNLRQLQDTNLVLYYRLLVDHLEEVLPIVYTPTVGLACQRFHRIFRRPRGLTLSYPMRDRLPELLRNRRQRDVDVIVVTDGERILGLGDQGAGGLGIPIGKLALYTAIGGLDPGRTLPIVLDVGTNNEERLADPGYLGWRHERIAGAEYDDFVERFVSAVEAELPQAMVQWEDFATHNARPILERYRDRICTFNDDIQGTAAVALGALIGAARASGTRPREHRIVVLGAGSAAIGVADEIRQALVDDGLDPEQARRRFWVLDVDGLLTEERDDLTEEQRVYARPAGEPSGGTTLADVVRSVHPTAMIGLSTARGAFTGEVVREMAAHVERPIIFPLSNPTARSEADPADLDRWTDGRALVATGSPFPPIERDGRTIPVSQSNNVYVFPAVGMGVVAAQAARVTDGMLRAASAALGARSPALTDPTAPLLPPISGLRELADHVALAVAVAAVADGVAPERSEQDLHRRIANARWEPVYPE
ncbi:NAD-dependent malic enzyme [Patulibacter medicamentivorans]|uniref:Putative malate oxidoreductase [NAD] n=1 Tax=Patulibacter medicamentivorans TaxID=1097667 RepID=H0E2L0_9ACTN|nr:NAD-dependent malic enzyme [Patulibacter medicamentivorans]EHN12084.1 NAD-dependent malic enzyme [Patulibacter medicamentivorans]